MLRFSERPVAGFAAGELTWIDRAFRWGGRAAETGEPMAALLARGGMPLRIEHGLVLDAIESGSLRSVLKPTGRILVGGIVVVGAAFEILGGSLDLADRLGEDRAAVQPSPVTEPYFAVDPPYGVRLRLEVEGPNERFVLEFERRGEYYAPLTDRPRIEPR